MAVYTIDPLTDPRWSGFIARHPDASIFHTREWLDALRLTYGYEPIAFTTSNEKELSNAVVFCRIRSWMTGRRLVSLPFSDHCQPLATGQDLEAILEKIYSQCKTDHLRYIEIRPLADSGVVNVPTHFFNSKIFSFQKIDLRPEENTIYQGFHDSCVRRKIRRADREHLVYEAGRSEELLEKFRHLLLLTRRRHKLPPQPPSWFHNVVRCLGEMVTVHVLSKDGIPIASIVTLAYRKSLVYKYGCSDVNYSHLGATPLLFWKAIQQARATGAEEFDLGRSDSEDRGLIAFKEHLGAVSSELKYYRNTASRTTKSSTLATPSWMRQALISLPDVLLTGVGRFIYRHLG